MVRFLAMMLNSKSEYFREEIKKHGYCRRIKNINLKEIRYYIPRFYTITKEYFLGIRGQHLFNTDDERYSSLYVVIGIKK